jgi:hypothetical protein
MWRALSRRVVHEKEGAAFLVGGRSRAGLQGMASGGRQAPVAVAVAVDKIGGGQLAEQASQHLPLDNEIGQRLFQIAAGGASVDEAQEGALPAVERKAAGDKNEGFDAVEEETGERQLARLPRSEFAPPPQENAAAGPGRGGGRRHTLLPSCRWNAAG